MKEKKSIDGNIIDNNLTTERNFYIPSAMTAMAQSSQSNKNLQRNSSKKQSNFNTEI
jgi:hypothetical protein